MNQQGIKKRVNFQRAKGEMSQKQREKGQRGKKQYKKGKKIAVALAKQSTLVFGKAS